MTKVHVDMNLCQSHGECTYVAPEIFELGDDDDRTVVARGTDRLRRAQAGKGRADDDDRPRHRLSPRP